jgi:sialate O-acetylesterase
MRKRVTLTAAEAAQAATLSLGVIDELDQTFVNGVAVGIASAGRRRAIMRCRAACCAAGVNEILVNISDASGGGGFSGPGRSGCA